jgi:hypothetical protein
MGRYHEAAYTLDPNQEVPEDAMPAAGTDDEQAELVKELSDGHREAAEEEAKALAEREAEAAERDPKPLPSELLAESGREPVPAEETEESPKAQ